jgi:hypothetical protein
MIRKFSFLLALTSVGLASTILAEPTPAPKSKVRRTKSVTAVNSPAKPVTSGWSYANGLWTHIDGYKLVNGQVVRSGVQTHKKAPPPPSKAEFDSVMNKKTAPKTPAEIAAEKAAQRDRNLAPRPPSQTGTHL